MPLYPIGYIQTKNPMLRRREACPYTSDGRKATHDNLRVNTRLMIQLMRQPSKGWSIEYTDNRISLYSAQWGKCAVTGIEFASAEEIHCHHMIPRAMGGSDKYGNLVLVREDVHRLIHAVKEKTIGKYLEALRLDKEKLKKLNKLRVTAGLAEITQTAT